MPRTELQVVALSRRREEVVRAWEELRGSLEREIGWGPGGRWAWVVVAAAAGFGLAWAWRRRRR